MKILRDNLLVQFSLFSLIIMGGLAVVIVLFLDARFGGANNLLIDHQTAMMSGIIIKDTDSYSISSLIKGVHDLQLMTIGIVGGAFVVLYMGLVTIIRRGWETIVQQRSILNANNMKLALLAEIGRIISSSLAIEDVYKQFADELRKLIHFDRIVVGLVDLELETFSPAYVIGTYVEGRGVGDIIPLAGSATEEIVRTKAPLIMSAESTDRFPATEPRFAAGLRSVIAVPLISLDRVIGFLRLQSTEQNDYTEQDLDLLERVGSQIAGAIANARLYDHTRRAEEDLQKAHGKLESRVEERTADLVEANESLLLEVTQREQAEGRIQTSLDEKEVLLREVHHRVKNNLQVISSLLSLQSKDISDNRAIESFRDSQNRVKSMALVHETLYQSEDLARINFSEYLQNLANNLFSSYLVDTNAIGIWVQADRDLLLEDDWRLKWLRQQLSAASARLAVH